MGTFIQFTMEQLELFSNKQEPFVSLDDVFAAYYECRKHKRRTMNALLFEINLEENLIQLWQEINNGTYQVGKSVAFIVKHPVFREVFAANFRDRVVHHLVIRKLWSLINAALSPSSYSCRPGMGTLYGVKKVYEQMQICSSGFRKKYYVLRLDIRGFFMHIQHDKLYEMLAHLVQTGYHGTDKEILLKLMKQIIFTPVQENCSIKGNKNDWKFLPVSKSLFHIGRSKGLPIGNLTSQIFANFYLYPLDRYISSQQGMFYGRYVDDMVLLHLSKKSLLNCKKEIEKILSTLGLKLHARKTHLLHGTQGFNFVGVYLLPHRIYIGRRLKSFFFSKLACLLHENNLQHILCVMNSYLGLMRHYHSYHLRVKGIRMITNKFPHLLSTRNAFKIFLWSLSPKRLFVPMIAQELGCGALKELWLLQANVSLRHKEIA